MHHVIFYKLLFILITFFFYLKSFMGEDIKVAPKLKIVLTKIRLPIYYLKLGLGKDKSQLIASKIKVWVYIIYVCV